MPLWVVLLIAGLTGVAVALLVGCAPVPVEPVLLGSDTTTVIILR